MEDVHTKLLYKTDFYYHNTRKCKKIKQLVRQILCREQSICD